MRLTESRDIKTRRAPYMNIFSVGGSVLRAVEVPRSVQK